MVALVLVPAAAGSLRPIELAGGPTLIPGHASMTASPVPVVVHIVSAIPYAVLGAFQFCRRFRRRWPAWQCAAGHVLVVLGLAEFIIRSGDNRTASATGEVLLS